MKSWREPIKFPLKSLNLQLIQILYFLSPLFRQPHLTHSLTHSYVVALERKKGKERKKERKEIKERRGKKERKAVTHPPNLRRLEPSRPADPPPMLETPPSRPTSGYQVQPVGSSQVLSLGAFSCWVWRRKMAMLKPFSLKFLTHSHSKCLPHLEHFSFFLMVFSHRRNIDKNE